MFGAFTADFLQGTREESQRLRGERQKIAEAFSQFKAQNPEASYADFRMFVDNMTDGSNYLRGALPTDDILKELGRQGERTRINAMAQREAAAIRGRLDNENARRQLILEARRNGIRDPNEIVNNAIKLMGLSDPVEIEQTRGSLMSLNIPQLLDDADRNEFDASLQTALQRVPLVGKKEELGDLLPKTLAGTPYADRFKSMIETAYGEAAATRYQRTFQTVVSGVQNLGIAAPTFEDVANVAEKLAPGMDPTERGNLVKAVWAQTKKQLEQKAASDGMELSKYRLGQRDALFTKVQSDPAIGYALKSANPEKARDLIAQHVDTIFGNELTPGQRKLAIDGAFENARTRVAATAEGKASELRSQVPQLLAKEREQNVSQIESYLKSAKGVPPNAQNAIQALVMGGFYIDPARLPEMVEFVASDPNLANAPATQVAQRLSGAFPGAVQSNAQRQQMMEQTLGARQPQRREDYLRAAQRDTEKRYTEIGTSIAALEKIQNPVERALRIERFRDEFVQSEREFFNAISRDMTDQSWALPDSAMGPSSFPNQMLATVINERNRRLVAAETRLASMLREARAAKTELERNTKPATQKSQLSDGGQGRASNWGF